MEDDEKPDAKYRKSLDDMRLFLQKQDAAIDSVRIVPYDDPATPAELLKNLVTHEDEVTFGVQYLRWLQHGEFDWVLDEDWERMLRQKNEKPAPKCRHGKNPLHCNTCYFET